MGKVKILAKYSMLNSTKLLFLFFALCFSAVFLIGNFAFLVRTVLEKAGIVPPAAVRLVLSLIGFLLFTLIIPPLRMGREKWFLDRAKGENPNFSAVFKYFNRRGILKSVKTWWYCTAMKGFALTLFLFPSICLSGILAFSFREGETSSYILLSILCADTVLGITGLGFYFAYSSDWLMYYGYAVSNVSISPVTALEKSRELCAERRRKIYLFRLGFLPWLISCVLIIPIPYVWGYYRQSCAMLVYRNEYLL